MRQAYGQYKGNVYNRKSFYTYMNTPINNIKILGPHLRHKKILQKCFCSFEQNIHNKTSGSYIIFVFIMYPYRSDAICLVMMPNKSSRTTKSYIINFLISAYSRIFYVIRKYQKLFKNEKYLYLIQVAQIQHSLNQQYIDAFLFLLFIFHLS